MAFDKNGTLFFTDSGPLGETTLFNPKGSLYAADPEGLYLLLSLNSLSKMFVFMKQDNICTQLS